MEQGNRNPNYQHYSEPNSSELIEKRACPTCGLKLSADIAVCPNDGTILIATSGIDEKLSGQYEFICEIGAGGMGVIYKARHIALNQLVAIKMLHTNRMDETSIRRFQQEAKAVSHLDHPSIVRVRDFGVTEAGQPHMVLDYIEGETLSETIEREAGLSIADSLDIFIQVCDALSHAHQRGVLHRDLKPSNIMLVKRGQGMPLVKIVDFGIAKIADPSQESGMNLTQTGEVFGSPLYMSPEQASGRKLDTRSDLYSFGCVMYETLTGAPPFVGGSSIETIFRQLNDEAPTLKEGSLGKDFPRDIEEIVARSLKKDPSERFASMDELKDVLLNCKTGKKQIIAAIPEVQTVARQEKKLNRPLMIGMAMVAVFALVIVATVVVKLTSPAPPPPPAVVQKVEDDGPAKEEINNRQSSLKIDLQKFLVKDKTLEEFAHCTKAQTVILTGAQIDGAGLAFLIHLSLKTLILNDSTVTDRGLEEISHMNNLVSLDLSSTRVSNTGLTKLTELEELQNLHLQGVNIFGTGLKTLSNLPKLQQLWLDKSTIGDDDLRFFATKRLFSLLSLGKTAITDQGVENLSKAKIHSINLSDTKITDASLPILAKMKTLKSVSLVHCNISPEALEQFKKLRPDVAVTTDSVNQSSKPQMPHVELDGTQ